MAQRKPRAVNIPAEMAEWISHIVRGGNERPFGIGSRDEYVRTACAILAACIRDGDDGYRPIDRIVEIVDELERQSKHDESGLNP